MRRTSCFLILLAAAVPLRGQHTIGSHGEKAPVLLEGLGSHSRTIQTSNPEAQKWFNQGLTMLYGFNRYESLRSFRKASELDPKAAMPHWGIAMATGPHINMDMEGDLDLKASCEAVHKAQRLDAPPLEKALLSAVAARCPSYDPKAYQDALRNVVKQFPDDLDAATLYAESFMVPARWRWFTTDGTPAPGMAEAIEVLESVMRRSPQHPGANHFYIHAVEMSPSPERAIPSAQRLMGVVPAAGHLVHMPGHIWMILGDFDLVADSNERAAEADREYMKKTGVTGSTYAGYYLHNLHFIAVARQMQGKRDEALQAAEFAAQASMQHIEAMAMMTDAFAPLPYFALLRFQRYDDILTRAAPDARLHATTAIHHYARTIALRGKGELKAAQAEFERFQTARKDVPTDWLWLNNKAADVLTVAHHALSASLAASAMEAVPHWKAAADVEAKLVYDEPPPFYYPVRESLGGALLRAGKAIEAEEAFREGLKRSTRNGRLLFGLMESLKAQGKHDAAAMVRKEFESAWKGATAKLRIEDL